MSSRNLTRCTAATLAAAACLFVMSNVGAVEPSDRDVAPGYTNTNPFSLPCHPSIDRGACLKWLSTPTKATAVAHNAPVERDPFSLPCHPALKKCGDPLALNSAR